MGNQVIFVVREDNLDEIRNSDFHDLAGAMHKGLVPSFTDVDDSAPENSAEDRFNRCGVKGVAFSAYHHAGDGAVIHVRHDMVNEASTLMGLTREDMKNSDFNQFVKSSRNDSKFMLGNRTNEKFSFRKNKTPVELNACHESDEYRYHVFGVLTDHLHEVENNPHVMKGIVDCIRGERDELPRHITPIGSYTPDQSILVKLYGNLFEPSQPFPARGDNLRDEFLGFLEARHGSEVVYDRRSDAFREQMGPFFDSVRLWSTMKTMEDLGYTVTPQKKVDNTPSTPSM